MTDAQMRDLAAKAVGRKDRNDITLGAGATPVQVSTFEALTMFGYAMLDSIAAEANPVDAIQVPARMTATELNKRVAELIGTDIRNKIMAIRLIREQRSIGLRDAKYYCDALAAGLTLPLTGRQWASFEAGEFHPSWLK